jgi:aminopeptidase N
MIERWLGNESQTQLVVLDLPNPDDVPWESGPLLAIPVRDGPADQIETVLSHAMTHAWMAPNPYWLNEGAANFMGTMWYDHQHQRDRALATLEGGRQALALEEPASPGEERGQPLVRATSPVYYRTKAAYILWMLRDIVGDDVLGAALRASNAAAQKGNVDVGRAFQTALMAAAPGRDFKWLFADWIDADHGLPDLTVDKVFPNAMQSGNWLVSVTISNAGYAAAEVPVTVRSATNTTTEQVFVPARGTVTPRLLVQGKPTEAQVNDGTVPETQATVHVTSLNQTANAGSAKQLP